MARPDYPSSRWYGAHGGNYMRASRPRSHTINKVVVHHVNGSWSSAINWFNDSRAGVSAHYTVRSSDGFIGQSVEEKDIAYHAGNWPVNQTAIGIEHEGFGNNPQRWFTPALYNSSARLTAYLCRRYGIPIRMGNANMSGILAHRQTTSTYCPGEFDFARYLRLVRHYFNQGAPAQEKYRVVVDNRSARRFVTTGAWQTSSFHAARAYGPDYSFAEPANVRQYAYYKIPIPKTAQYHFYAWYPSDPGYNNAAVYWIKALGGWRRTVVNQRLNGGRWNHLGTFYMRAGDAWSMFTPRQSAGTGLIIADAVMVLER